MRSRGGLVLGPRHEKSAPALTRQPNSSRARCAGTRGHSARRGSERANAKEIRATCIRTARLRADYAIRMRTASMIASPQYARMRQCGHVDRTPRGEFSISSWASACALRHAKTC